MMKIFFCLITFSLMQQLIGAENGTLEKLKAANLGYSLFLASEVMRDAEGRPGNVDFGITNTLDHQFAETQHLGLSLTVLSSGIGGLSSRNAVDNVQLKYKKERIYSWVEWGMGLEGDVTALYYTDPHQRRVNGRQGEYQGGLTLYKVFSEKFILSSSLRYLKYQNTFSNPYALNEMIKGNLTPFVQFHRDWSGSVSLTYGHKERMGRPYGDHQSKDEVEAIPSLNYHFSKDVITSLFWKILPFKGNDHRLFARKIISDSTFGLTLFALVF